MQQRMRALGSVLRVVAVFSLVFPIASGQYTSVPVLNCRAGVDCVGIQLAAYVNPVRTPIPCTDSEFKAFTCDAGASLVTCPSGYFCKDVVSAPTPCPSGHFCSRGSREPTPCLPGSICGAKSYKDTWVLLLVLFLVVLVSFVALYYYRRRKARQRIYAAPFESLESTMVGANDELPIPYDLVIDIKKITVEVVETTDLTHAERSQEINAVEVEENAVGKRGSMIMETKAPKKGMKTILHQVSGKIRGGRLTAIMGPSGSGKTTMLSALLNRVQLSSGRVEVNSDYSISQVAEMQLMAFVPQDDTMLDMLTVRDLLSHSAVTRLPGEMSHKEKIRRVNHTMQLLGLTHIADVVVGNDLERGVSGGERKRVSIGMELVCDPLFLCLDEPTSGLDSAASLQVCSSLRRIASRKTVVICVIHQPRYEIFEQFDDIILLARGGHLVYFGPVNELENFFAEMGFTLPNNCNPADFYMDVVSESSFVNKWIRGGKAAFKKPAILLHQPIPSSIVIPLASEPSIHPRNLSEDFQTATVSTPVPATEIELAQFSTPQKFDPPKLDIDSPANATKDQALDGLPKPKEYDRLLSSPSPSDPVISSSPIVAISPTPDRRPPSPSATSTESNHSSIGSILHPRQPASFFWQFYYVLYRCALQDIRYPKFLFIDCMLQILPGIALAIPFLGKDQYSPPLPAAIANTCLSIIADRCANQVVNQDYFITPTFYLTMIIGAAAHIYAINTFGRHMSVYRREVYAGLNKTSFFLAKNVYDLMNITRGATIFVSFYFFLNAPRGDIGSWLGLMWCLFFAGYGVGYLVSFIVSFNQATTIAVCAGICFSVTSGLAPKITTVSGWGPLNIFWYLSYNRWGSEAMVVLQNSGADTAGRMDDAIHYGGYSNSQLSLDIGMVFVIGIFWRLSTALIMWKKKL